MIQESTIKIDVPDIPGLSFRLFAGPADLAANVALNNACSLADGLEWIDTLADAEHWLANIDEKSDPYKDLLIAEVDGEMIAKGLTRWWKNDAGEWLYGVGCEVHPAWRGKGLDRAILNWQEQHCRDIAATQDNAGAPQHFQTWADSRMTDKIALLKDAGYRAVRYGYDMTRSLLEPIPEMGLPAGFEMRLTKPEHYRAIFDADNEAFRDHWGHRAQTEADFQRWQTWKLFQPEFFRVAWDIEKNEVAGMVLNFVDWEANKTLGKSRGYTEGISVRRPYRKLGIAKALIAMSFHLHKSLGLTEAALGVDAQNPNGALQLYESMGFVMKQPGTAYRKELV